MGWISVAALMYLLKRRRINPRSCIVYLPVAGTSEEYSTSTGAEIDNAYDHEDDSFDDQED